MPTYIYDYKTIETALNLEDILLYTNPNATFTAKQTHLIRDAINNTVDTDCDLWCYNIEIKDGQFYPDLTVHTTYKGSYIDLGQREDRASYLAEQAEGQAFDSIDEIRIYMNDGLDTPLLEEIMADYEESQPEEIDLEGAEMEIDECPEPECEPAAQTPTEPQTDAKTGVKTMIKNTINKAKNLFNKLKPTTTKRVLDQGIYTDPDFDHVDYCQLVQTQKGKKLSYTLEITRIEEGEVKHYSNKYSTFEHAVKDWGGRRKALSC